MNIFKYIMIAVVMFTMASCKKDQYYLYNDIARIQFGPDIKLIYNTNSALADTLKPFTFYYDGPEVTQDTVFFDIYAIGGVSKTDRVFTLEQEQLPNANNAIPGKHYVAFSDPKVSKLYVIKAGTVHTKVPVIVLRDPSLKTTTPVLKLNVVADATFQLGERKTLWRKIEMTDRLSRPSAWTDSYSTYYYGAYSTVKHAFMINATGQKWDQVFMSELAIDLQGYYLSVIKTALIDYNNAHPGDPLKDEKEQLVIFP
jgi:hypothetical protein